MVLPLCLHSHLHHKAVTCASGASWMLLGAVCLLMAAIPRQGSELENVVMGKGWRGRLMGSVREVGCAAGQP